MYLFESIAANSTESFGLFSKLRLFAVVSDTVLQYEIYVVEELLTVVILVRFNFLGHRFKVHRIFDDAVIVFDKFLVDRFEERPSFWQRFQFAVDNIVQDVRKGHLVIKRNARKVPRKKSLKKTTYLIVVIQ